MKVLRIIDAPTVRQVLTMADCIDAVEQAMVAVSTRAMTLPMRQIIPLRGGYDSLFVMPGSAMDLPAFGAKLISLLPGNAAKGLPSIQGFVALFDRETGALCAIVEGGAVTAMRTAAASGLAVRLLAREGARTHGVIGAGVQAQSHIEAIFAVRPDIEETLIFSRSFDKAQHLASTLAKRTGRRIRAAASAEAASACDIVSVVTGASEPVLRGKWLRPGAHVNLVGAHSPQMREADTEAILRAEVYVDALESALAEAGDIVIPLSEGAIDKNHIRGEIGAVAAGLAPGRGSAASITLYKSVGVFAQDLFAAWRVFEKAEEMGEGVAIAW